MSNMFMADALLDILTLNTRLEYRNVILFCHGYTHGIQFGIRSPGHPKFKTSDGLTKGNWRAFVDSVGADDVGGAFIGLYACSTGNDPDGDPNTAPGSGDGSFGDELRDGLCRRGLIYNHVFTHYTAAHSWWNPNVKIMRGRGSEIGGVGSSALFVQGSPEYRAFRKLLKMDYRKRKPVRGTRPEYDGFVWLLPFMSEVAIQNAVIEAMLEGYV